jgi:hypothetical protein
MQICLLNSALAVFNIQNSHKVIWVYNNYQYIALKEYSTFLPDRRIQDTGLDWRRRAITQGVTTLES